MEHHGTGVQRSDSIGIQHPNIRHIEHIPAQSLANVLAILEERPILRRIISVGVNLQPLHRAPRRPSGDAPSGFLGCQVRWLWVKTQVP